MKVDVLYSKAKLKRTAVGLQEIANEATRIAADRVMPKIMRGIIRRRFSGKGPFPPPQHRLGVVTGFLRANFNISKAEKTSGGASLTISNPAFYWPIHEYGWAGVVRTRAKTFRGVKWMDIPARAPMTVGLKESRDELERTVGAAVVKAVTRHIGRNLDTKSDTIRSIRTSE